MLAHHEPHFQAPEHQTRRIIPCKKINYGAHFCHKWKREEGNSRTSHKFQNIGVSRDSTIIILVSVGLVTGSPNLFSISHASGKGIFQCVETRRYLPVLVLETLVTRKSSNAQRECKSALAAKVISAHLHLERSELCRGPNSGLESAINQDYDERAENPF